MRKPRDWEWKKIPETPDNHFEVGEMMAKEEDEEVESLYRDVPGLKEYVEAGHTGQDFVDNYETLGFDIAPFQYHLCRFRWNLSQLVNKMENLEDWEPIPYETVKIPNELALKIAGDVIPEKYKTWGFALYFTDNDFGWPMEIVGRIVGEQYKKEFFGVVRSICEFEENYTTAEYYCDTHLGKYFDERLLKILIDKLYSAGDVLSSWEGNRDLPKQHETDQTKEYLRLPDRDIKIGNEEEIRRWLVQLGWTEEYPDHIWCNSEVLIVLFKDSEIQIHTW